jgi:hypothetical protein
MPDKPALTDKVDWSGKVLAVQPRIRLLRSFDQRSHSYQGYVLRIEGICGGREAEFLIAVGKGAQAKHGFCIGMSVSGMAVLVSDPRLETAAFYKASQIRVSDRPESQAVLRKPEGPEVYVGAYPLIAFIEEVGIVHTHLDCIIRAYGRTSSTGAVAEDFIGAGKLSGCPSFVPPRTTKARIVSRRAWPGLARASIYADEDFLE